MALSIYSIQLCAFFTNHKEDKRWEQNWIEKIIGGLFKSSKVVTKRMALMKKGDNKTESSSSKGMRI